MNSTTGVPITSTSYHGTIITGVAIQKYVENESSPIKMQSFQVRPISRIKDAVELRIQVKGKRPPVWRRVIVHPDTTLNELHRLISVLMGWADGRYHHFEYRGSTLQLEGLENETLRISEFASGAILVHIIDEKEGPECRGKIVRKDRDRTDQLPELIGGMRTMDGSENDPYNISSIEIESRLRTLRGHEDRFPDRNGTKVEPWRVAALTRSNDFP